MEQLGKEGKSWWRSDFPCPFLVYSFKCLIWHTQYFTSTVLLNNAVHLYTHTNAHIHTHSWSFFYIEGSVDRESAIKKTIQKLFMLTECMFLDWRFAFQVMLMLQWICICWACISCVLGQEKLETVRTEGRCAVDYPQNKQNSCRTGGSSLTFLYNYIFISMVLFKCISLLK